MSTRKKRQHFVPQGYLQRFKSENSTFKVPRIWVVDRFKEAPFNVPIQTVASRDAFYDSIIDEGIQEFESHGVENLLQREEEKFYASLRCMDDAIQHGTKFSDDTKASIAWYVYIQFIRTSKFRENLQIPEDNTIDDYKKMVQFYGFTYTEAIVKFITLCLSKSWVVYKMNRNLTAFTSDNPVIFNFDDYEDALGKAKRGEDIVFSDLKGMRIIFPLDSRHVLFLYDKTSRPDMADKDGQVMDFDTSETLNLWQGLCSSCERHIYISEERGIAEVVKGLLSLDETLSGIKKVLSSAVEHVRNSNDSVKGTKLNSYTGYLAEGRAKTLFDAIKNINR